MKYCKRPYTYLYVDNDLGDVYICPWMEPRITKIGNLVEEDLDKIWRGEKAEYFRNLFREGCYKHCRMQGCPRLQNNDLPDIEDEKEYEELSKTPPGPTNINLAYDFVCNQHCETCRPKTFAPPPDYAERMRTIRERITPYINTAEQISASGHGDPFASPYMMDLLAGLRPENPDFKILLETNGVCFDEEHWERISHLGQYNLQIVLTSNSFDEFTYRHISAGGNYKKLMHNLRFIKTLRERGDINTYTSSFVIQDRNFREIPSFIERSLNEFGFDDVVLKPVYQWGTMPEKTFWFKDVLNPKHPYHPEYLEIMQNPICRDKRVYNFGGDTEHPARDFYIEGEVCVAAKEPDADDAKATDETSAQKRSPRIPASIKKRIPAPLKKIGKKAINKIKKIMRG